MGKALFETSFHDKDLDGKIVIALERISQAFRVLLWEESKAHALSPIQVQILIFCAHHPGKRCKVGYLAEEFNVTKPTVSDAVKLLVFKGYLTRQDDPTDSRSHILELTREGQAMAQRVSTFTSHIRQPISSMPAGQKNSLLQSLLRLISQLQRSGIISLNRMCFSCRFYQRKQGSHYCHLLKSQLADQELRVDCPEYEPMPT